METNLKNILYALKTIGIPKQEILCIYLFGSQYWGYATTNSDIDLYVILKKDFGIKQQDVGKISFRYISTISESVKAITKGSWARFYVLKYASKLLYGKKITVPNFPKGKIIDYLEGKKEDVKKIPSLPLKWGYITLMARIFFINYLLHFSKTYNLNCYAKCPTLNKQEKDFISRLNQKLFSHTNATKQEKGQITTIIKKLNRYIISKSKHLDNWNDFRTKRIMSLVRY